MTKVSKIRLGALFVVGLVLLLATTTVALFRGYFDHGQFEVQEANWSSSTLARVAVVAKRSDHQAMDSDVYFVVIADHVLSPTELRMAYHSDQVDFAAANDCVSVRWIDPHNLEVSCRHGTVDSQHIDVLKRKTGNVAITFVNVADSGTN
jgi:hypothetical protein